MSNKVGNLMRLWAASAVHNMEFSKLSIPLVVPTGLPLPALVSTGDFNLVPKPLEECLTHLKLTLQVKFHALSLHLYWWYVNCLLCR